MNNFIIINLENFKKIINLIIQIIKKSKLYKQKKINFKTTQAQLTPSFLK